MDTSSNQPYSRMEDATKKRKREVKEVAEIALVLATMAEMRGGGEITLRERELMEAARTKLVKLVGELKPRDVFPMMELGAFVEDLGLDRVRDEKGLGLGFTPPAKLSIAEKVLYTKQKFERAEANALRSATQSSHGSAANTSAVADSRGAVHPNKMFTSDKAKHGPVSSGVFHNGAPHVHNSAANSTSLPYQLPASEVRKPMVASGLPNSLPGKESSQSSRTERSQVRLGQRSSSYAPQMQANIPGGPAQPAWDQHTRSASLAKSGAHDNVLPQNMATSRIAALAAAPRPLASQTTSGHQPNMIQHMQRTNVVQTSNNTHSEISKVVQNFLQPHLPKRVAWNPPSRDYMNKSVTCQVCKLAIVETENLFVCDACEHAYHMKCLRTQESKVIPKNEWHCFRCLSLTDGKPLPPKYGRVTRNIAASKAASLSTSGKKAGISSDKANKQKVTANGSIGLQNSPASNIVNTNTSISNSNVPNERVQGTDMSLVRHNRNDQNHPVSCKKEDLLTVATTPSSSSAELSNEEKLGSKIEEETPSKSSDSVTKVLYHIQSCSNGQDNDLKVSHCSDGIPSKLCNDNHLAVKKLENIDIGKFHDGNLSVDVKEEKGVAHLELVENSRDGVGNDARASSDDPNIVDWIGDVAEVADEKTYYSSCCVNGNVYKVQDHALFLCDNKPMPSKIKTMWEDNNTRLKWVIVNRCYFPGDLPAAVGHPCSREANEVYESNHGCTILASLIQGPCDVLHSEKFIQESERRSRLGSEEICGLPPLFQCRWFYDELKGSFRDLSILLQPDNGFIDK